MIEIIGLALVTTLAVYLLRRYAPRGLIDGRGALMKDLNKRVLSERDRRASD